MEEVVGILPCGIDADVKMNRAAFGEDSFEPGSELAIAVGALGESEFLGGGLEVIAEEGGIVAVASGIDTDTDGADGGNGAARINGNGDAQRRNWSWTCCNILHYHGAVSKRERGPERSRENPPVEPGTEDTCDERSSLKM